MKSLNYTEIAQKMLKPEIVSMLTTLHEYKIKEERLVYAKQDVLDSLVNIAKIQSTEASNKIEGIFTSGDRLEKLVKDKTMPKNRNEKEIAGYRDVLKTIHENYEYIPVKDNMILQLHRDLYKFCGGDIGGRYKIGDNIIAETDLSGRQKVRFEPVPAWETPSAVSVICREYNDVIARQLIDPLLVIPVFILDFLCVHPFADGNGRMSRLLTLLLLYRNGYNVGKYISIEKAIENTKETYYEVLQESSYGWHEGTNNYEPFVCYTLGILLSVYRELEQRLEFVGKKEKGKPSRVADIIKNSLGAITKTEIMKRCPDISQVTVQRALSELLKSGKIIKIGGGRYTEYVWNRDRED